MKFKELQQLLNDIDSIEHGEDEILVLLPSARFLHEFEIKKLAEDENNGVWYIEIEA